MMSWEDGIKSSIMKLQIGHELSFILYYREWLPKRTLLNSILVLVISTEMNFQYG
jgi:hypothetical protein